MNEKIILCDADGVLLEWEEGFHSFMDAHGKTRKDVSEDHYYHMHQQYENLTAEEASFSVRVFNESARIGYLGAFRDSVYYVNLLYQKHGYKLRVISSLGEDTCARELREMNLYNLFGNAIDSITLLSMGAPKDEALAQYKDSNFYWIEDHPSNFQAGLDLGLNSILLDHGYNRSADKTRGHHVTNWKEIYQLVTRCE
jgi:FMN phosphatase YigB (HAD superfamily)